MNEKKPESWKPIRPERYVVSVDRQAKSSFASSEAARAEAKRISDAFPKVVVAVSDTEQDSITTLVLTPDEHQAHFDSELP
jgi:hypothetical protein